MRKSTQPVPQIIPSVPDILTLEIDKKDTNKYLAKLKTKEKPAVVFFGSDSFVIPVLKALDQNFDVKAVVTASNSEVANYFKGPILTPIKLDENFITYHLSLLSCDLFVISSYGKILPQELLDIPKFGALNIHPSMLPKDRGASPIPEAILNGDKLTGVTIIKMDEKMDHGPILVKKEVAISPDDTFETLANELFSEGAKLLVEIIPEFITGKAKLKEQNHQKATYTKLIKKEDGYFEINNPPSPEKLEKMVRAYYPWPGVWTRWKNKIVKFLPRHSGADQSLSFDMFLIQMEGKKPLSLKDFHNGYPDFPIKSITIDKK